MKKFGLLYIGVIIIFIVISGVIAQEIISYKCIQTKITCDKAKELLKKENDNKIKEFQKRYSSLVDSKKYLNDIINIAPDNYDMVQVKEKLNIFNKKVDKFLSDYQDYLSLVSRLSDNSCNIKELNNITKQINLRIDNLKQDTIDIRDFAPQVTVEFQKLEKQ